MNFGSIAYLKTQRRNHGITQAQLAAKIGVSIYRIQKVEQHGDSLPPPLLSVRFCRLSGWRLQHNGGQGLRASNRPGRGPSGECGMRRKTDQGNLLQCMGCRTRSARAVIISRRINGRRRETVACWDQPDCIDLAFGNMPEVVG